MKRKNFLDLDWWMKSLASLRLAVVIMLSLSVVVATGTIIEARFDAQAAAKLVYHTWWLQSVLTLLVVNLTAVMVDRWPWQWRHAPFVLAHIGIITLLGGAWLTKTFGVDGTMRVGIGQTEHLLTINETELSAFETQDLKTYKPLFSERVDFFTDPPEKKPRAFHLPGGELQILQFYPYSLASRLVVRGDSATLGAGVRFQLNNSRVHFADWLVQHDPQEAVHRDLGPAVFHLVAPGLAPKQSQGRNEIYLSPDAASGAVRFLVLYKDPARPAKSGVLREGERLATGWMDLEFQLLRYFPQAEESWDLQPVEKPTELTNSAVQVSYLGQKHWLQLDDVLKLADKKGTVLVGFSHARIEAGFPLHLEKFKVGRYPGSMMASSYSSQVQVPDLGSREISMNEPLKYQGLTVYQSSFQQDEKGEPIASVFSINADPGRWFKYLGSFLITTGAVWMFVNRRRSARALGPQARGAHDEI